MKKRFKKDLPMLIGFFVAMCISDVILKYSFDFMKMLLRIIVTIVVYFVFRFIESKVNKN